MNQQKSLIRISELLARFKIETSILNSNAQLDINIVAEDILIPLLNIAFNCNLTNAKYSEYDSRFPALDLLDKKNRIAFQITSTSTIKKVKETIEKIVRKRFYTQFDNFYIYIITQKHNNYDKSILEKYTQNLFKFTVQNILDEKDLFQKIASQSYENILKFEDLLEKQFSDRIKHESKEQNKEDEIIRQLMHDSDKKILVTELSGMYEVRQQWLEKKIFFENKIPAIFDIDQQYASYIKLMEINEKIESFNNEISKLLNKI